jgi:hypothetical protein
MGCMDLFIHNAGIYSNETRNGTADGHAGNPAVNTFAEPQPRNLIRCNDRNASAANGRISARPAKAASDS